MKARNFVLLAVASSAIAMNGEPIDLGCNARGPLAALRSSIAFRKAIGAGNPANYLSSISDVNGQQLAPGSFKALQCPLFIDSDALPSPSASKAILLAEATGRTHEPDEPLVATDPTIPIVVSTAVGVVAEFPQPETQKSEERVVAHAAAHPEADRALERRAAAASADLSPRKHELQSTVVEPKQETALQPLPLPKSNRVESSREQNATVAGAQESAVMNLAEAIGLIRETRTADSVTSLEIDPVMALFDFLGLFSAVLAFCLLVFHPGLRQTEVRNKADLYRAVLRGVDLRAPEPMHVTPRRGAVVQSGVLSLGQFANSR